MTTATKFTILRVLMIPLFMVLFLLGYNWAAMAVFIVASLTDFVDGYIARHYNQTSDMGKFLDPLADKLLVFAAMLILCQFGRFPAWALMLVLTREFAVSGLRMVAAAKGSVIAAGWSGKIKTASTMVALCVQMVQPNLFAAWPWIDTLAIAVIVGTTVVSGVEYFCKNGKVLI